MKQGPIASTIIKQALRNGTPIPEAIANAPELMAGLQFYFVAFLDLTSCRSLGMGNEGPIWWTAIDKYAGRLELEGERREDLFHYISEMDKVYLEYRAKEAKKSSKATKGTTSTKGRKSLTKRADDG